MFNIKFMDGSAVPIDYQEKTSRLVSDAACADIGEENENQFYDMPCGKKQETASSSHE